MRNGQLRELTGESAMPLRVMPLPGRHNITTLTGGLLPSGQYAKNPFISNNPKLINEIIMFLKLEYNL